MTYEIPLDGYDGRIDLQTLARRVSRACVHYLQVLFLFYVRLHVRFIDQLSLAHRLTSSQFFGIVFSCTTWRRFHMVSGSQCSPRVERVKVKFPKLDCCIFTLRSQPLGPLSASGDPSCPISVFSDISLLTSEDRLKT